jgi:hypothetical protein
MFVDTWAWLALSNQKDVYHEPARKEYEEMKKTIDCTVHSEPATPQNVVIVGDWRIGKTSLHLPASIS